VPALLRRDEADREAEEEERVLEAALRGLDRDWLRCGEGLDEGRGSGGGLKDDSTATIPRHSGHRIRLPAYWSSTAKWYWQPEQVTYTAIRNLVDC
jgi:hypothetical protein